MDQKTVMFVLEDRDRLQDHYKNLLRGQARVLVADGPLEARDYLAAENIDLIVLGLAMSPEGCYPMAETADEMETGLKVAEDVPAITKHEKTPIVIYSISSNKDGRFNSRCLELQVDEFLVKTF
jgi:CheY-like chemotaxis protein